MDYELSDSSGTDDDLPPSHQNIFQRGPRVAGNARSGFVSAPPPLPVVHGDMETQIHLIEQEAYCSVLRAFKAQSDALSWEKEGLITELRKELRVSDEEHRELLSRVNTDDMIRKIREWRKAGGHQPGMLSTSQPVHELVHSPTVSASRKKPKTTSMSMGAPSPAVHPSSGAIKRGPLPGPRTKKPKSFMQYPSSGLGGRPQGNSRGPSGTFAATEPAEPATYDPLIGKKVWTRWPDDNNFYEAVITDYNTAEGRHALVYDINTGNETWEWVNLKEDKEMRYTEDNSKKYQTDLSKENVGSVLADSLGLNKNKASVLLLICYTGFTCPRYPPIAQISPEDIRWEGDDPGASRRGSRPGQGRGNKKPLTRGGHTSGVGRGRGMAKNQTKKDNPLSQNGVGKKALGDIELLHTDTLIKEVEKLFSVNHPDPAEIDKAKRVLKEHEQALVDAIARLEDASDGESDEREREHPYCPGDQGEQGQGRRKRQYDEIHGSVGRRDGVDHH